MNKKPVWNALPRLLRLHRASEEKYKTYDDWRNHFGFYKEV
jgi:hypothetical protein